MAILDCANQKGSPCRRIGLYASASLVEPEHLDFKDSAEPGEQVPGTFIVRVIGSRALVSTTQFMRLHILLVESG